MGKLGTQSILPLTLTTNQTRKTRPLHLDSEQITKGLSTKISLKHAKSLTETNVLVALQNKQHQASSCRASPTMLLEAGYSLIRLWRSRNSMDGGYAVLCQIHEVKTVHSIKGGKEELKHFNLLQKIN